MKDLTEEYEQIWMQKHEQECLEAIEPMNEAENYDIFSQNNAKIEAILANFDKKQKILLKFFHNTQFLSNRPEDKMVV